MRSSIVCLWLVLAVSGCAGAVVSDDSLRSRTADVLAVPDGAVVISNRHGGSVDSTYTAVTAKGTYGCRFGGGGLMNYGLTTAPVCTLRQ